VSDLEDFDAILTPENGQSIVSALSRYPTDGSYRITIEPSASDTGKWGMARLWRAWMSTTGDWMAARGAKMPLCLREDGSHYGEREFNPDDAHELFTSQWLALDKDGSRLSWSKKGRDGMRPASKGERYIAMLKHQDWASERGILLFKPRDSEFARLERDADGL